MRHIALYVIMSLTALSSFALDPTATHYSFEECLGSQMPYPERVERATYPDSLHPVFINHVGRHGARFPSGPSECLMMKGALHRADSLGTITALGRKLLKITEFVISNSDGRWGALDSLGMAEQRAIASRMIESFYPLFKKGAMVEAISSYSPRAMMSMYTFTHQLDRISDGLEFSTTTGRMNSLLLRPFDLSKSFKEYRKSGPWKQVYAEYVSRHCPLTAIERVLGKDFPYESEKAGTTLALAEYHVLAGLPAAGLTNIAPEFFSREEINALWGCVNLGQYLQRVASSVSLIPEEIAGPLVLDLISSTDKAIEYPEQQPAVRLRFGHAETLMPLFSLLHLPGCYYITNYPDTVGLHWRNFNVVPMASNIQMILFRSDSGRFYLRTDVNEHPVPLIPGTDDIYVEWGKARDYIMGCVPLNFDIN